MSNWLLETCRELEWINTRKKNCASSRLFTIIIIIIIIIITIITITTTTTSKVGC